MPPPASVPASSAVHPHGRGDNEEEENLQADHYGSPPRAWGQWDHGADPAARSSVHPHGRGDNSVPITAPYATQRFTPTGVGTISGRSAFQLLEDGSPPRAWGQSYPKEPKSITSSVHPHGRGDNDAGPSVKHSANGSPPRAWGQL